ncbi:MAG: nucleoside recognition domain-containing protein [Chloroflexi bacterium]|nr:nucleoside recognition domain-containing protein [Chloroflexota bacterium]
MPRDFSPKDRKLTNIKMSNQPTQLKTIFRAGIKRGWRSFIWINKIFIPISLLVTLLQWTGWLNYLHFLLNPLMSLINLPPEAALPIISAMTINLYAGIAAMTAIPFTPAQMTLIAVFTLICHNLIIEGIIQHQSGLNIVKTTLIRTGAATITVLIISRFLGDTSQSLAVTAGLTAQPPLLEALKEWAVNSLVLLLKILGIVMTIMTILQFYESLNWTRYWLKIFRPLMKVLRLSDRVATLWTTSVVFGLMYGGAVIIDEAKKGTLTKEELEPLHISVGINHSMVEDPTLFTLLGLNPFWLWIPKLLMAIVAVQAYRTVTYLNHRLRHQSLG